MSESPADATTLPELVRCAAACYGAKIAVTDGEVSLSFIDLEAARRKSAAAFLAAGLASGDRIAIWAPNIYQWIIAAVGAQSVGGVLVPLNTRLKGPEAAYILRTSGARFLFTVSDFLDVSYPTLLHDQDCGVLDTIVMLSGHAKDTTAWQSFLDGGSAVAESEIDAREAALSPEDTLDILFTSGTTGTPKGVVTRHRQNIRVFAEWSATVGLRADDNYLIINPFFHSFGYKAGWLASIIRGACILPVKHFDLDRVLVQIARDRVSMIPGPPTIYQSLLAHPEREKYDLSSLRLAVTGAAPVPVALVKQMREVLGFEVVLTAYGLTESCGVVSMCRADDSPERISQSSGKAMHGIEMKCVDSDGNSVDAGIAGEIWCRGFNVMAGYLNNPQATAETITEEGWLKTGDVGVMDGDGYVQITDRIKDMFIVGGFNCYPAEIENALCSMPGIARAAVIGVSDERMGEVARAYLVVTAGATLDEHMVMAWCRDNMANYKVPRSVEFVTALPMNASGKVLKTELRAQARGESR
ncbi:MAG: acyl-CoA synthetase (AMP-forming)/AMP-acid ligase II [Halieaceae bacterium]|jgi:acyl-CoA synthetase (AMP-forming)/AMP-acid ligase II